METPGSRFQFWVTKVVGVSIVKMSELIGVEHRTLYNVVNNQNVTIIGKKTLQNLKKKFPKFPWTWIREGIGEVPDNTTAVMAEETEDMGDYRIKDMEITALRKENEGLRSLVDAAENNNKRLETMIMHYENMYLQCAEEVEKYKQKNH